MERDEVLTTVKAMQMYGGGFVKALAAAWLLADEDNSARIEQAFPEYVKKYGPDSSMFLEAFKARHE